MRVIILNGSPKAHGNTATALHEVERTLQQQGIETEWYHRLEHIVQQVTHAYHEQYRQRGLFLQVVHLMKCG